MKNFNFLPILLIATSVFSQGTVPAVFVVYDFETNKPITDAAIMIREANFAREITGLDGKAFFKSVPIGEIEFTVNADGYLPFEDRENVSTEIKKNTFKVFLNKLPKPGEKKLLIYGNVSDKDGNDVKDAWVEFVIANITRTVKTDQSGNYNCEIDFSNSKYAESVSTIQVEVKVGDCKINEVINKPEEPVRFRKFVLDCPNAPISPPVKPLAETTMSGVKIVIERFEQNSNIATFYFSMENMKVAQAIHDVRMDVGYCQLIDENANTFKGRYCKIGNIEDDHFVNAKLIYPNPVKGFVQFDVNAVTFKMVSYLKLQIYNLGVIEFTNISVQR